MLYVHEILTIVPWTEEVFWTLLGSDYLPEAQQNGLRLVGLFKVGIRYSENYALWEVDDWATLDRLQEFHDKDWWMKAWKLESIQYRTDWLRRILEPAPFSPTLAELKKGDYKSTFYLHCLARAYPGKVKEYIKGIGKELVPLAKKWGMKLVGCYSTVAGEAESNEVISIWTAGNANIEWGTIREAAKKDPALKDWEARAAAWRPEVTFRHLFGFVKYSPLRAPFFPEEEIIEKPKIMVSWQG
jgi:hypothetical protein